LLIVKNVNGINNSAGAITCELEVDVYFKSHVEKMKMDVYDLERTNIILGMP